MKNTPNVLNVARKIKNNAKEIGALTLVVTAGALPVSGTAEAATKHGSQSYTSVLL